MVIILKTSSSQSTWEDGGWQIPLEIGRINVARIFATCHKQYYPFKSTLVLPFLSWILALFHRISSTCHIGWSFWELSRICALNVCVKESLRYSAACASWYWMQNISSKSINALVVFSSGADVSQRKYQEKRKQKQDKAQCSVVDLGHHGRATWCVEVIDRLLEMNHPVSHR